MTESATSAFTMIYNFPAAGIRGLGTGDWGLGTGDWGLGTGDWGQGTGDRGLGTGDYNVIMVAYIWGKS